MLRSGAGSYSLNWDWLSLNRRVGVRFLTKEICLARDSAEECRHVGECFPWERFVEGQIIRYDKQGFDEERELSKEVANYLKSENYVSSIDNSEPILHPPVHSIRKPCKVMCCSTLLKYD